MNNSETLDSCPICFNNQHTPFLKCIDYTVSRETFTIVSCLNCGFKFTNPRPTPAALSDYYKSDEYISHSNSKKGVINRIYQLIREYTRVKKLQLITRLNNSVNNNSKQILDIGCGTGEFLNTCKSAGWTTIGIEPSGEAAKLAIQNYGLNVFGEEALANFNKEQFDIITMWHVLEHVSNLKERICELKRLLKPTGKIIIAVPNCSSFDASFYKSHWAAYDVPRHLYHFAPNDIRLLFKQYQLKVCKILPMAFDSFYVSMLSERYRYSKLNFIKAIMIGLWSNIKAIKYRETYSSQLYIIKHEKS